MQPGGRLWCKPGAAGEEKGQGWGACGRERGYPRWVLSPSLQPCSLLGCSSPLHRDVQCVPSVPVPSADPQRPWGGHSGVLCPPAPPTFTETPPQYVEAKEGSSVTLTCMAFGNPKPIVTWLREGDLLGANGKYQVG